MWNDPFLVRNMVSGVEDSLISTTGVLVGLDFAGLPIQHIIVAGIVLILVEAMSMAFGTVVSEESFFIASNIKYNTTQILMYAATMFFSYLVAGTLVLLPYLLKLPHMYVFSIVIAIVSLFLLILLVQKNVLRAFALTAVGGLILAVTIFIGRQLEKCRTK